MRPRAAHSAVYVEITDSLYVFGGYDLNHVLADLEVRFAVLEMVGYFQLVFRYIIFKVAAGAIPTAVNLWTGSRWIVSNHLRQLIL